MRILFASTQGAGHVGPLLPFAHACERAGHDVLVAAPTPAAVLVARAGLAFSPVGEPDGRAEAWAPVFSHDAPGMAHTIQELFIGLDANSALPAMLDTVERWQPDLIVRETCEFASAVAAERHGVPLAQVGIHLDASVDAGEDLFAIAAPALERLGLERAESMLEAPVLTTVPPSLGSGGDSGRLRRFRASDPPALQVPDLVYVSFGSEAPTTPLFPSLYRDTIEALGDVQLDVLVTIGQSRDPSELGPIPRNTTVRRWVPQAQVMPRAAAVVGHGGSGSTLAALAAGVPLAFLPLFVDGPENARRVAATGAGLALRTVADLPAAVGRLIEEPAFARAAYRIALEMRDLPPADAAVDLLALA